MLLAPPVHVFDVPAPVHEFDSFGVQLFVVPEPEHVLEFSPLHVFVPPPPTPPPQVLICPPPPVHVSEPDPEHVFLAPATSHVLPSLWLVQLFESLPLHVLLPPSRQWLVDPLEQMFDPGSEQTLVAPEP